jgi:hypothetical protein
MSEVPRHEVPDLLRAVNERIREFDPLETSGEYDFICECLDDTCTEAMHLTWQEYETGHVEPDQFAVLPGHEQPGHDVVLRTARYFLVQRASLAVAG